ncbi:MAG: Benzoate 1,2-dioxygenase electron transfer protein [candidate division WWE3 bacterium GW2011_GWB1_47_11]|uniref:Benzoate 1,2-dioxygenase electron transfer protein n=1 Tax=candidate division WWE3 bacterium GW2011_GWB1_47_11 TaxID=1619117 RepID=A0A0G1UEL2_UNCKA|nr:MAG: Benzoate 1,2-dioxygenase electron transfer protein [candidate division WWE3 bacterium GW2011_GWB1_47_11]
MYKATVLKKSWMSSRDILLTLTLVEPVEIDFTPGQFVSLKVDETAFRAYSICSSADNKSEISLLVSSFHNGLGANYVKNLNIDSDVTFVGPGGRFMFSSQVAPEIVFVCTGTGIAPFVSMLHQVLELNLAAKIRLVFGVRTKKDVLFLDFLNSCKSKLNNFDYKICLSQEKSAEFLHGRVTDNVVIPNPKSAHVYLCGHPNMVDDMKLRLAALGVPQSNVFSEKFTV